MKKFVPLALAGALALGAVNATPAQAHHSAAMFNSEVNLVLTGTVARFDYLNPHSWLYVDIVNEDGSITQWGFETDAPPRLRRLGVGPNFFEPGDIVTIKTNPLHDGRPAGALRGAIFQDGTEYGNVEHLEAPTEAAYTPQPEALPIPE